MRGIEPLTFSLPRKRSTPELHRLSSAFTETLRAGDEARTRDLQLGRLSLYQLSYSRVKVKNVVIGGGRWTRTTEPEGADLQSAAIATMRCPHDRRILRIILLLRFLP